MAGRLERVIETALVAGILGSAVLLLAGLAAGSPEALRWGILLLMITPVVRVLVLTLGLFLGRDWLFGLVSFFVLAVLASGMFVSMRLTRRTAAPAAQTR